MWWVYEWFSGIIGLNGIASQRALFRALFLFFDDFVNVFELSHVRRDGRRGNWILRRGYVVRRRSSEVAIAGHVAPLEYGPGSSRISSDLDGHVADRAYMEDLEPTALT